MQDQGARDSGPLAYAFSHSFEAMDSSIQVYRGVLMLLRSFKVMFDGWYGSLDILKRCLMVGMGELCK